MARLTVDEIPVEQRQRLRCHGCDHPLRRRPSRIAQVERLQHRHDQRPLEQGINRSSGRFFLIKRLPNLVGIAVAGKCLLGHVEIRSGTEHFRIEPAAHGEHGVADRFNLQSAVGDAPQKPVFRILGSVQRVPALAHAVRVAGEDQAVQVFDRPALPDEPIS